MKKKQIKLSLKKETISNLSKSDMSKVKGGTTLRTCVGNPTCAATCIGTLCNTVCETCKC